MNNGMLKFIGTGSAFNTELGCNSAYIKRGSSLILIDCGGDVFGRLKEMSVLTEKIRSVTIFITHTHPDHVGSLGDLIYYCFYILGIKAQVITTEPTIETLLALMGVTKELQDITSKELKELYDLRVLKFNQVYNENIEGFQDFKFQACEVNHYPTLRSAGYQLKVDETTLYFSGDGNEIPHEIYNMFLLGRIDELYQDTSGLDYKGNPHLSINKLEKLIPMEYRRKVFCMHLDTHLYAEKEKIEELGFNRQLNDYEIKAFLDKGRTAIYPGSFDPITNGHLDMIEKASKMYKKLIVAVLVNNKKTPLFSMEERLELITKCVAKYPNVEVKTFEGLLVDFAKEEKAEYILKGLRSMTDFDYELQMAMANKSLAPTVETVFLIPELKNQFISSSLVKEVGSRRGDISWIVPGEILQEVEVKLKNK